MRYLVNPVSTLFIALTLLAVGSVSVERDRSALSLRAVSPPP
jgi:hypothetical protein